MKKASAFETSARQAMALSVYPQQRDHALLENIFRCPDWPLLPGSTLALRTCRNLKEALRILRNDVVPVVLCEQVLQPGTWKDMVEALATLPDPPYLIVTSKHADDRLWAEALNLGAYDVIPTPFDTAEVIRILSVAWLRWSDRHHAMAANAASFVA